MTINKKEIISEHKKNENDTGSVAVQVAILTSRIQQLTSHFKTHKKDLHSRRGLLRLVANRKKLLSYIKRKDIKEYTNIISVLNIRK